MNPATHSRVLQARGWPVLPADTPIIYEDEEDEANDMGEANRHYETNNTLFNCVKGHLRKRRRKLQVYANMNCYYAPGPLQPETGSLPYFSSDVMVVEPFEPLPEDLVSYTIGRHGPSPLSALEVLSKGNAETNDKQVKVLLYARLKIGEYILVDPSGEFLKQKLLLKQLQPDGTWMDFQDDDGGVTSKLGFRLMLDEAGHIGVFDASTGKRYRRPDEAETEAIRADAEAKARRLAEKLAREEKKARQQAEQQVQALREELERLRQSQDKDPGKNGNGRSAAP